jgi:dipeptidyl aminopeptidase/acylaminoacyl peptidase
MRRLLFLAGLVASAPVAAQQTADPAELYGARESVEQIDLSPDGRHVVYLQGGASRGTVVYLAQVGSTEAPRLVVASDGNPERLNWCNFATNERLVCRLSGMVMAGDGTLVPFSRRVAIDTDGQHLAPLGERQSMYDARIRQNDGQILDWLPDEGAITMQREHVPEAGRIGTHLVRTASGLGVDRIDLRTMRATQIEPPNERASGYLTDGHGEVRIMWITATRGGATGQMGTSIDIFYRRPGSREWLPFSTVDTVSGAGLNPLAVDRDLNAAYALRKLNGRFALYRVKLDGTMATELVYANEQVDVDDLVSVDRGARNVGVSFADDQRRHIYFDPALTALATSLGRALPNLPLIDFVETSADGNRVLIHAGSDADAGRYYVYDRAARSLNEILMVRPQLEPVAGAQVRALTYPAADGTQIPAYLTLPPGGVGRNLPAVILPHGGPAARDEWGFNWLAQYLAHLGYAVLQPNYRGSAGYGDQWLQQNGFRSWRTSIGDITAGARWLAEQGVGDPSRMAIIGWSYGGYAALQAGVTEPVLFKAVVAIAPVTDLQQAKDDFRNYTNASNVAEYIGAGPHIEEGSPLRHVAAITAPVLLFHGDRDVNVSILHSRRMNDAMRAAGKRSELVTFAGLEHDLADARARVQMLRRIGAFLGTELAAH